LILKRLNAAYLAINWNDKLSNGGALQEIDKYPEDARADDYIESIIERDRIEF
jgi:hypothetical protein